MLDYCKAFDLDITQETTPWLIEGLWLDKAVGIIGGEPKCYKSFLGFELCVSVALGKPTFGHFPVSSKGNCLLYAAEDSLTTVRLRLEAAVKSHGCKLTDLDVNVITVPSLSIDNLIDQKSFEETIKNLNPRLVVLDPFVRLHSIDENISSEVAKVLAFLRRINRQYGVAIAVVHHARKRAGKERPGQSLRGSSEFHAWGDSNLYVKRCNSAADADIELTIEHRSAPSREGVILGLEKVEGSQCPALKLRSSPQSLVQAGSPQDRITEVLSHNPNGLSQSAIRRLARMRNETCSSTIKDMMTAGKVLEEGQVFKLKASLDH